MAKFILGMVVGFFIGGLFVVQIVHQETPDKVLVKDGDGFYNPATGKFEVMPLKDLNCSN